MDENKLNNFSKKLFDNYELEKPPKDFTEKLMLRIEEAKSTEAKKAKSFFANKFMLIFIFTFSFITLLSYFSQGSQSGKPSGGLMEKLQIPSFDLSILSKYLNINIEIGLIAKLVIGSIIALIVIDLASGSLIDRIIDSKTKKESKV
jgi:hypothetical protein